MLTFHEYKGLHLVGLLFFIMSLAKLHWSDKHGKFLKPLLFSSLFITLATGTILMVRWGLTNPMPPWIWGKYLAFIGLTISVWYPTKASKFIRFRDPYLAFLIIIAVYCSVYKPM